MAISATFSLLWLFLLLAIAAAITWFFYRNNAWLKAQGRWLQWTIPALRGLGLFLLLTLLLEMTLIVNHSEVEAPILITVFDNSSSIKQYKDSAQVKAQIAAVKASIEEQYGGKFQLAFYTTGEALKENGSVTLSEHKTNLSVAFKHIAEQYLNRNIGAIILASDGNYNDGDNPTYSAEQISLTPIYSLGIGDTTPKKDQIISNMYYNDVVFLRDQFPIEIDLEAFKIKNKQVNVRLTQHGKLLGSEVVNYDNKDYLFKQIRFNVTAEKIGFQPFTVSVEYVDGEHSKSNNSKTCYIEVIDSRNNLCFISNGVHPDIAALRSVAEANENYQSKFLTPKEMVDKGIKPDLLIWHNPTLQLEESVIAYIEQYRIPVLYIINPNAASAELTKLRLFSNVNNRNQTDEVQAAINPGFSAFELSEPCKQAIEFYPPLITKFGSISPAGNTEVFLNQRLGNAIKNDPLLYFGKTKQNTPYGVIYGEGVWRWKLNEFMKYQDQSRFNELFTKVYAYLMVKREGMGLSVQFDKRFGKYDRIGVNANFYNASLEPITSPEITLTVIDGKGKKYVNRFNKSGTHYALDLGVMAPGSYQWTANTVYLNKKYVKKGGFVIEDIGLEQSTNTANHGVLKQLAKNSGGGFERLSNYKTLLEKIAARQDIVSIERLTTDFWNLVDSWLFLLTIAIAFALEWFLKRFYGAY